MDHAYFNGVIEQYIEHLNRPDKLLKKDRQPGNIYHVPVVVIDGTNSFQKVNDVNDQVLFTSRVRDAQIIANQFLAKKVLGYITMSAASRNKRGHELLSPIIRELEHDIEEKYPNSYNNEVKYVGESYITFIKNEQGNYFTECENAAGYELKVYSCCALNPPPLLTTSFDKDTAKNLWNIRL